MIRNLCPKMENLHLCTSYDDTVIALAKFRNIKTLSIFRLDTKFELPSGLVLVLELLWQPKYYMQANNHHHNCFYSGCPLSKTSTCP